MATYDLTSSIPAATDLKTGDILNCPYSGNAKTITLPTGIYKLECWGAQGGSYNTTYIGGKGGYSVGTITLTETESLCLYVGGQGKAASSSATGLLLGGFNGGGNSNASTTYFTCSGGGASDIRIGGLNSINRIIVAGGGGGACYSQRNYKANGGYGGGTSGGAGVNGSASYLGGTGGTATAAGKSYSGTSVNDSSEGILASFGSGGGANSDSEQMAGGGGGWYGGGYARRAGAGGGSGYVYTSATASQNPNNSNIGSSYYLTDASTIAGDTSFTDYSGSTVTGHQGNGAIRITVLSIEKPILFIKTDSNIWSKISKVFMKISDNEWTSIAGMYLKTGENNWKKII